MADSGFCDSVKVKRVGLEGMLIQVSFWLQGVQLPFTALYEVQDIRNLVGDVVSEESLAAKVRPFSEDFKARLTRSYSRNTNV